MKNISIVIALLLMSTFYSFAQADYINRAVEKNDTVIIRLKTMDGEFEWQKSTDKTNWETLTGIENEIKFIADQTTYFRVISTIEGCFPDTSTLGIISVYDEMTDIDGNTYKTIQIGDQIWMAENLRVTHYPDGKPIFKAEADSSWAYTDSLAFCWYKNDSATYAWHNGAYYNWAAAMYGNKSSDLIPSTIQGVCPAGWHLPSDGEWQQMEQDLGMSADVASEEGWHGTNQGPKLAGKIHLWKNGVLTANDQFGESGFNGLPTGDRTWDDGSIFYGVGVYGTWWSATEVKSQNIWTRYIQYDKIQIRRRYTYMWNGNSVRCVKD